MGKAITYHHHCRCLGRDFTFGQWISYLKEHPDSGSEVVFRCNGFDYNVHDVCLNPRIVIRYGKPPFVFEIKTAQSANGRWEYGIDATFNIEGMLHGCSFREDPAEGYDDERTAVYNALELLEKRCTRAMSEAEGRIDYDDEGNIVKNVSVIPKLKAMLAEIRRYKDNYDPKQLTLF